MRFPLSPILADIFMEEFKTSALRSAHLHLRYVDDTFVVWPHGRDTLQDFLKHLNEQHSSIKFTMEVEEDRQDPVPWCWHLQKSGWLLALQRFIQETHPHRPLPQPTLLTSPQHQVISQPHPCTTRLRHMWPRQLTQGTIRHIKTTLQRNGYNPNKIQTTKPVPNTDKVSLTLSTYLPYLGSTSHKLQRILQKAGIQVYHSAPNKLQGLLHTHTRKNPIPATEREYTGSLVSVEKCTSVKQDEIALRDLKNIEHTAAEEILRNHLW